MVRSEISEALTSRQQNIVIAPYLDPLEMRDRQHTDLIRNSRQIVQYGVRSVKKSVSRLRQDLRESLKNGLRTQ